MTAPLRLLVYGLVLAAVFVAAFAVGRGVGPLERSVGGGHDEALPRDVLSLSAARERRPVQPSVVQVTG